MSVFAVTLQTRAAAERCGADPEVWCTVHALHSARAAAIVTSSGHVSIVGPITGISDRGFTVASAYDIPWSEACTVIASEGLQSSEEGC